MVFPGAEGLGRLRADTVVARAMLTFTRFAVVVTGAHCSHLRGLVSQRRPQMTKFARRVTTLSALLLLVSISTVARAQEYTITDLGDVAPTAINESGVIVGYAPLSGAAPGVRAFVWKAGVLTLLPTHVAIARSFPQEATFMLANGINRSGQVVGHALVPSTTIGGVWGSGEVLAFLYDRGKTTFFTFPSGGLDHSSTSAITDKGFITGLIYTPNPRGVLYDLRTGTQTTLSTLGGSQSALKDVNNAGVAVGSSHLDADYTSHAFRYTEANGMEDLGTLGGWGSYSYPNAINARGVIVGLSSMTAAADEFHAFQWEDGVMSDLGTLGGRYTEAYDINRTGNVVGVAGTVTQQARAFVTIDGIMTDLNVLLPPGSGWELHYARAINDAGQIIGQGFRNGVERSFLLTPTTKRR